MADFKKSFSILTDLEFSSPSNALEYLPTEDGYTYMGIYQGAHPTWEGWGYVRDSLKRLVNLKEASKELYGNLELTSKVEKFYKVKFWDVAKLDEVNSQKIADEIFIFGVNVGMKRAITLAQDLAQVLADGVIGRKSLEALNKCDEDLFDSKYDVLEQEYYSHIIESNPSKQIFARGWRNRAFTV